MFPSTGLGGAHEKMAEYVMLHMAVIKNKYRSQTGINRSLPTTNKAQRRRKNKKQNQIP